MAQDLSLLIVFAAGLLSFLSPCVVPLIPGYIAFVSGISIDEISSRDSPGRKMASAMLSSVMFVLGFSFVFVVMGASAMWLGGFLLQRLPLLTSIAGAVIIFFGLQQIGLFKFFSKIKTTLRSDCLCIRCHGGTTRAHALFRFDVLNPFVVRMMGANINRRTMDNIRSAGWTVQIEKNLSSDVVRWIEAAP